MRLRASKPIQARHRLLAGLASRVGMTLPPILKNFARLARIAAFFVEDVDQRMR